MGENLLEERGRCQSYLIPCGGCDGCVDMKISWLCGFLCDMFTELVDMDVWNLDGDL